MMLVTPVDMLLVGLLGSYYKMVPMMTDHETDLKTSHIIERTTDLELELKALRGNFVE